MIKLRESADEMPRLRCALPQFVIPQRWLTRAADSQNADLIADYSEDGSIRVAVPRAE